MKTKLCPCGKKIFIGTTEEMLSAFLFNARGRTQRLASNQLVDEHVEFLDDVSLHVCSVTRAKKWSKRHES